ncbi:MAG: hypothetical protein UW01_C0013G0012 [Candidatus Nomurabacteria bacterium GW2011_GWA2_43_66]|uniref:Uncharacterized protein n=1 Tax=Candidatus Nomurabacteria bacterium GW2011_GWF2_43_24 TaxID=1618778 RepID=A0A0G1GSK3_9BACT|nr:MAG: hypothetical protein UV13_C0013G0012 [Parcubacteria group bacterium GW2011_GWC1_42_21]KKS99382.1 MAG: hypothetical protein UV77_C0014G0012 [Candidatus Nomurabacteria bacterium GW2011_GWA1_43_17]KKT06579.1 MAG: hypothetical protein UV85_C0017G0012 [Candidatus Nomurabacteria bacterium GW2011_GWB1_43_19]KKT10347.1 MAG: hypothetical protein UV91_C0014G0012 [Candidatus Nomurabacteria bacterium GW2011_GWF2_43_24]KKT17631.1 MAG: hypothetical protein UW01_C0013G0012 [Candidatus Nomurabacteria b
MTYKKPKGLLAEPLSSKVCDLSIIFNIAKIYCKVKVIHTLKF